MKESDSYSSHNRDRDSFEFVSQWISDSYLRNNRERDSFWSVSQQKRVTRIQAKKRQR